MKIIQRGNVPDYSLPLPIFTSLHVANAICKRGEEFDVLIGLDERYVEQLKKLSLDESDTDLQNSTGDRNRFGIGSYEDWYKKSRTMFALIHKQTDALAALIWLGPKPLGKKFPRSGVEEKYEASDDWHTISWRSYPGFRGRGMMKNFTKFVMDTYREKFPQMKLWFITEDSNKPMQKLGSELGFEKDETMSESVPGSVVMVKLEGPYIRYHRSSIIAH